ncbi:MAG: YciI family protein [Caulobacteraceae bacterium]
MALFVIAAEDKPGALDLRLKLRPEHLAYMAAHKDMVKLGGPYLDGKGDMAGSLVIIEAESMAAAQIFAAGDPFAQGGLFESSSVRPWRVTLGGLA